MKSKRCTTEEMIRILREADAGGRTIAELCKEKNISEVTFHRWKREFGMMDANEAKRLKELERENTELKKMLAESLLENRVLRFVNEKIISPGYKKQMVQVVIAERLCCGRKACRFLRLAWATW